MVFINVMQKATLLKAFFRTDVRVTSGTHWLLLSFVRRQHNCVRMRSRGMNEVIYKLHPGTSEFRANVNYYKMNIKFLVDIFSPYMSFEKLNACNLFLW